MSEHTHSTVTFGTDSNNENAAEQLQQMHKVLVGLIRYLNHTGAVDICELQDLIGSVDGNLIENGEFNEKMIG